MPEREIQKTLWIGLPGIIAALVASYFLTRYILISSIIEIQSGGPAIRIYPGAILAPFLGLIALMMLIVLPLKAYSILPSFTSRTEKPFNLLVLMSGVTLVCVLPFSTLLQQTLMPPLGYSKCVSLQGQPSLWFTDWIRNPELCVKGKSLEWVAEQASRVQ